MYEVFAGSDLSGPAYRIVRACPPTVDDFTVWAPPEVLLERLVQCAAYD
jgi:hypothetical protein